MPTLDKIADAFDAINEWSGRAVAWLTVAMVVVTFAVVALRYLFNMGWIAMQESVTYMHALVFMIGAAYTLRHDGHVRVDIFYGRFSRRGQAWVDLGGALLLLLPVCMAILWLSWGYVTASWSLLEGSQEAGGLPGVFLLKTSIPLMAVLMILQGLSQAARSAAILMGRPGAEGIHDMSREI